MNSYLNQSNSLKLVQQFGPSLENEIRDFLGWNTGRLAYYTDENYTYDVQVDGYLGSPSNPQAFVSVTYCSPDKPGHSNENKLQLKLGELMLLKSRYPNIKGILVIGGTKQAWLAYVLEAFEYFFDEVIYTWDPQFNARMSDLKNLTVKIQGQHSKVWEQLSTEWKSTTLLNNKPIDSYLRENAWNYMKDNGAEGLLPENIKSPIIRECMSAAYETSLRSRNRNGKEWTNYLNEDWAKLWESRSYFNPGEAVIELLLKKSGYAYQGGIAKDVAVPSLIHHLGGENVDKTKVSEDFILFSQKFNKPIFIQSKATGGGKERHGKNIQNRTKEQIARSLFYRGYIKDNSIALREKDFIWIGVLDGNWGVTKKAPHKYLHMLQWAGYDKLIAADNLATNNLDVQYNNELSTYLAELDCVTDPLLFNELWSNWLQERIFKK